MARGRESADGIHGLTAGYEAWLRTQTDVVEGDLARKHEDMRKDPFPFLRGTYYAWTKQWPTALPDLAKAPTVTAIGDLHLENFGTWRDAEGRLAWGVNDFDEASVLPYTNDLVRLAASTSLAYRAARLATPAATLCAAFLKGYRKRLKKGGRSILLAERHQRIGERVLRDLVQPRSFWKDMRKEEGASRTPPRDCKEALERALPAGTTDVQIRARQAGIGSLGRPRFVAIGTWQGGKVAREAKARVASAAVWANGGAAGEDAFVHLVGKSSHDPFLTVSDRWVVRRLAPDSDKIEIKKLRTRLERELAALMGRAVADVHLATPAAKDAILDDLGGRKQGWLLKAAREMAELTRESHRAWKKDPKVPRSKDR